MEKITFVLNDQESLIWSSNLRISYQEFCSELLSFYLKEYDASIQRIIKTSKNGSTTIFNLNFDD